MRWLITAQLILLTLAIQIAWVPHVIVWDAWPDVLLILVVQIAFSLTAADAFVTAWCTGLLYDLRVAEPAGMWAMLYGLAALAVSKVFGRDRSAILPTRLFTVLLASLLVNLGGILINTFHGHPIGWLHVKRLFLNSFYTTIAAIVFLPVFAFLMKRLHPQQRRG